MRQNPLADFTERKAFSNEDLEEFSQLLNNLGERNYNEITKFFEDKYSQKLPNYDKELAKYQEYFEERLLQIASAKNQLKSIFDQGKKDEAKLEDLNERLVIETRDRKIKGAVFRFLKKKREERISLTLRLEESRNHYFNRKILHSFSNWKRATFKNGLQLKLKRRAEEQALAMTEEYMSIINFLQNKILELEDSIKRKRLAKQEFTFQLSKSLLKTISNLSMEVINLNQVNVKDKMSDLNLTNNYMDQLNNILASKMNEVEQLRIRRAREEV
eukprot:TRINITY_DN5187_c0_g1_i1.p1 TRINITY_DN5187_c0_g1~~TRINITY_DN5187_c0_g1_i1.p1  ORF type:complete len:273 (+),score=52.33 TRINITY_DN5187_c0_g1_i1:78-896(+)